MPLPCRHTSRFLLLWLLGLPLVIWQVYSWATPVVMAIIAYFLFGVEAIGLRIEQPFEILPIPKTLNKCRADIKEMLACREGMSANSAINFHQTQPTMLNSDMHWRILPLGRPRCNLPPVSPYARPPTPPPPRAGGIQPVVVFSLQLYGTGCVCFIPVAHTWLLLKPRCKGSVV